MASLAELAWSTVGDEVQWWCQWHPSRQTGADDLLAKGFDYSPNVPPELPSCGHLWERSFLRIFDLDSQKEMCQRANWLTIPAYLCKKAQAIKLPLVSDNPPDTLRPSPGEEDNR